MLCSGPADFNATVSWTAIQILQFYITWFNEPCHHTIDHFGFHWSMLSL